MVEQQCLTRPATLCFVGPNNLLLVQQSSGTVIVKKQPVKYIKKLSNSCCHKDEQISINKPQFNAKEFLLYPGEHSNPLMESRCHKYWIVLSGLAWITVGQTTQMVSERQSTLILPLQEHSIRNSTTEPLKFIEVCTVQRLTGKEQIQFIDNPVFI